MTASDPVLQLLGLAARAGAIVAGTSRVVDAVRGGRVRFVVVASDLTDTGRDKLIPAMERERVRHVVRYTRAELGLAVGRSPLAAVGVADAGFGGRLAALLESEQHNRTQDDSK